MRDTKMTSRVAQDEIGGIKVEIMKAIRQHGKSKMIG